MPTPSNVSPFPSARLKMAAQLRLCADRLSSLGDDEVGDAFLLQLDEDGIIHTTWLLDKRDGRALRMIGVLRLVEQQLLDAMGCECGDEEAEDDRPTN